MSTQETQRSELAEDTLAAENAQLQSANFSERDAIARAQQGDSSAFEFLYRRHCSRVYALSLRMIGNTAEAEDLTQEVFLLILRKIRSFRGESAFSTWLHRVTVNLVLMRLRRKTCLGTSLEETRELPADHPGAREELAGADLVMTGAVDRLNLQRAMDQLCPFQKLVVVLHDIQGYKHTEIAEMMDWSIGNSKSRLHRARARLRSLLRDGLTLPCIPSPQTAQAASSA
ncbi:MAG: sigma-70 family RNA polymerase sigma factor [Candidatus Acidiferrum sp.]